MRKGYSTRYGLTFVLLVVLMAFLPGCGSSQVVVDEDEWADQWDGGREAEREQVTEQREPRVEQLQRDNAQLREELARQTQENRSLNARIAELEKRLTEERERIQALEAAPRPEPARARTEPERARTSISRAEFDREYTRAVNLFMDRKYQEAKDLFTQLLNSGVDHPLVANCQYWQGEALYGMREYREAIEAFQKVFNYPSQVKHDDAQVMIANSYYMLGQRDRARQEYQRLLDRYPNSDYVAFARQRLRDR
jgi:tol-pal system protein YbgF